MLRVPKVGVKGTHVQINIYNSDARFRELVGYLSVTELYWFPSDVLLRRAKREKEGGGREYIIPTVAAARDSDGCGGPCCNIP